MLGIWLKLKSIFLPRNLCALFLFSLNGFSAKSCLLFIAFLDWAANTRCKSVYAHIIILQLFQTQQLQQALLLPSVQLLLHRRLLVIPTPLLLQTYGACPNCVVTQNVAQNSDVAAPPSVLPPNFAATALTMVVIDVSTISCSLMNCCCYTST